MQQILSVPEAIESRHSIRKFVQESIAKEDINRIFELVRLSPSAWNLQPWRFHVVTDPTLKDQLKEAAYGQSTKIFIVTLTAFLVRTKPASSKLNPHSMNNTIDEAITIQTVFKYISSMNLP